MGDDLSKAPAEMPPQEQEKSPETDPINDEFLKECELPPDFLPAELVEELLDELPPEPASPPPIPHIKERDPQVFKGFGRKSVKSTNYVMLLDPRRPNLVIDRLRNVYSEQKLHEAQYDHLAPEIQELINLLLQIPFVAAVAESDWQNPPKFSIQYTIIADREEKDRFNAIFADKAFFNKGIKHRALSIELKNLPNKLTDGFLKFIDPADFEQLNKRIKDIIKKLLAADPDSPVYESVLSEMESLSETMPDTVPKKIKELIDKMPPKIKELVDLVKRVELDEGSEELHMIEFEYPTWELKETWNYLNPHKLLKRRKYRKLLEVINAQLREYVQEN